MIIIQDNWKNWSNIDLQYIGKINLIDHVLQLSFCWILPQGSHHRCKFLTKWSLSSTLPHHITIEKITLSSPQCLTEGRWGGVKSQLGNTQIGEHGDFYQGASFRYKTSSATFLSIQKKDCAAKWWKDRPCPHILHILVILPSYRITTLLTRITAIVSFAAALTFWI